MNRIFLKVGTVLAGYNIDGTIESRYLKFSGNRPSVGGSYRFERVAYLYREHMRVTQKKRIAELGPADRIKLIILEDWVAGNGRTLMIGKVRVIN